MVKRSLQWHVVGLLFVVAVLNYFDRQSLSVVAPRMQLELKLSDTDYAHIVSLFLMASACAYALSGFLCDAIGVRRAMAVFVAFWSLAELSTAFAFSIVALGLARFCLGLGEPGLWVAAPKAVQAVVDKERRGVAIGVYTAGATLGAILAIPAILAVTSHLPWRSIFLIDGALGLAWVPVWWLVFRDTPSQERPSTGAQHRPNAFLKRSETWRFLITRGLTDPVWYFFLFWLPKFLASERHVSVQEMSRIGWLVYFAAGIGTVAGGLFSSSQIRRGRSPALAYRHTMAFSAAAVVCCPLVYVSHLLSLTMLFACVVALAHMSWLTSLTAALLEVFPAEQLGRAAGIIASGSAFGGMISSELIALALSHGGYKYVFYAMGCLHLTSLAILWPAFTGPRAPAEAG